MIQNEMLLSHPPQAPQTIQLSQNAQIARAAKLARLRAGESIRVLDLFGGCGGLSLGFKAAGFEIVGQVEIDSWAAKSHAANFFGNSTKEHQAIHAKARDITTTEPKDLVAELGLGDKVDQAIDIIVGGPPCQAFARVGRAKLREVAEHPEAFKLDPRGNLYLRFLYYIEAFQPLAILMENVPDVINYGLHNIPEETCEVLEDRGYNARYTLLNAAFYGVPQMRERMFLIAYLKELDTPVRFPRPTHWTQLPRGYEACRKVALKHLELDFAPEDNYYVKAPAASPTLPAAITAQQALADLPVVTGHLDGTIKRGPRRFITRIPYGQTAPSEFAMSMRNWENIAPTDGICDHVIRVQPRDYALFRRMQPGDEYPEAHKLAQEMLCEEIAALRRRGVIIDPGTAQYKALEKQIVPPYDPKKFPNKWRKMEPDKPARTLMAHLGKDGYSHIHYDSNQARTISVREAARLQSFPDGFVFCGTMNPAFRQIGNAVPPYMAKALARKMMAVFRKFRKRKRYVPYRAS